MLIFTMLPHYGDLFSDPIQNESFEDDDLTTLMKIIETDSCYSHAWSEIPPEEDLQPSITFDMLASNDLLTDSNDMTALSYLQHQDVAYDQCPSSTSELQQNNTVTRQYNQTPLQSIHSQQYDAQEPSYIIKNAYENFNTKYNKDPPIPLTVLWQDVMLNHEDCT